MLNDGRRYLDGLRGNAGVEWCEAMTPCIDARTERRSPCALPRLGRVLMRLWLANRLALESTCATAGIFAGLSLMLLKVNSPPFGVMGRILPPAIYGAAMLLAGVPELYFAVAGDTWAVVAGVQVNLRKCGAVAGFLLWSYLADITLCNDYFLGTGWHAVALVSYSITAMSWAWIAVRSRGIGNRRGAVQ